ncbi:MAG: AmmeMemoRadiSam system radical SAM enzyme [Deltaproteobacteria bacterium]|nr:AmmeMemoRadiSam system radical SAM enzyme [Deltaproteobacteria bacterium]
MREASLYRSLEGGRVECLLCSHNCKIADNKRGICGVRGNVGGKLYALNYGKLIAEHTDPIEKKPLFHFLPGTRSYSIATAGCNFRCMHCQNSDISQMPKEKKIILGADTGPEEVVATAASENAASISYTYTEPTIFYEFARDAALIAKKKGFKNIFVTNGFMSKACLEDAKDWLDAANVDIKAFTEDFYKKICGARLKPVLDSVVTMRSLGIWVELTTLVIPGKNDSEDELRSIAKWIVSVDESMPWHVSAFYPSYRMMDVPPTPVETLRRALEIGYEEGLKYVYTGNIPGEKGESTFCPSCKALIIERRGYSVLANNLKDGKCHKCGALIEGVWN